MGDVKPVSIIASLSKASLPMSVYVNVKPAGATNFT
jgi:hypothetical protein